MTEEDQRKVFEETGKELERALKTTHINLRTLELIKTAMRFGYSTAYCARTCDMDERFNQAETYHSAYDSIIALIEETDKKIGARELH
jgi:hypothetical protein